MVNNSNLLGLVSPTKTCSSSATRDFSFLAIFRRLYYLATPSIYSLLCSPRLPSRSETLVDQAVVKSGEQLSFSVETFSAICTDVRKTHAPRITVSKCATFVGEALKCKFFNVKRLYLYGGDVLSGAVFMGRVIKWRSSPHPSPRMCYICEPVVTNVARGRGRRILLLKAESRW